LVRNLLQKNNYLQGFIDTAKPITITNDERKHSMFDEHDEKAREIVNEFFNHYVVLNSYHVSIEPRVFLLASIARALKEVEKNTTGKTK